MLAHWVATSGHYRLVNAQSQLVTGSVGGMFTLKMRKRRQSSDQHLGSPIKLHTSQFCTAPAFDFARAPPNHSTTEPSAAPEAGLSACQPTPTRLQGCSAARRTDLGLVWLRRAHYFTEQLIRLCINQDLREIFFTR